MESEQTPDMGSLGSKEASETSPVVGEQGVKFQAVETAAYHSVGSVTETRSDSVAGIVDGHLAVVNGTVESVEMRLEMIPCEEKDPLQNNK